MAAVHVVIFHQRPRADDSSLGGILSEARDRLVGHHIHLFRRAGAEHVDVVAGRDESAAAAGASQESFGARLAGLVTDDAIERLVVLGSGAVPGLSGAEARRLVAVAGGASGRALTNNRYSSDICAISEAGVLRDLPPLPSDNALPRWLEERAGYEVDELAGRDRLALDLDTPLDVALLALRGRPRPVAAVAAEHGLAVPRRDELRALAGDPHRELLVFGRSGSRTLRWLERNVRCRVRFLAEERGLRASSPLAIGGAPSSPAVGRPPHATLGRLLERSGGPGSLASVVAELADGAIVDSRVLMADRSGADEEAWPSPADRFASDLLRPDEVADPWLRELTDSAAGASIPILLGSHTLIGPGIPLVLGKR